MSILLAIHLHSKHKVSNTKVLSCYTISTQHFSLILISVPTDLKHLLLHRQYETLSEEVHWKSRGMKKGLHNQVPRMMKSPTFKCKRLGLRFWWSYICTSFFQEYYELWCSYSVHFKASSLQFFPKSSNLLDIKYLYFINQERFFSHLYVFSALDSITFTWK